MSVSEICVHSNFIWLEIVSNAFRYRDAERERQEVWLYATIFSICVIVLEWCQENGIGQTILVQYDWHGYFVMEQCVLYITWIVSREWWYVTLSWYTMTDIETLWRPDRCCYIWQEYQIAALVFALHVGSVHVELRLCINLSNEHNYSVIGVIREVPVHLIFY